MVEAYYQAALKLEKLGLVVSRAGRALLQKEGLK
jgi:hypothetical protein